jgi:hypothetical protein
MWRQFCRGIYQGSQLYEKENEGEEEMKAISIKQPWASLIAHGIKYI